MLNILTYISYQNENIPKYQKLEDIQQYAKQNNLCPYYIAYTDDLQVDYQYFYKNLTDNIFYTKSYNNEFVAFIDEHIIHFRGDITRKHIQKFVNINSQAKCRIIVFDSLQQIENFNDNISIVYTPTITDQKIQQLNELSSKTNLQIGITSKFNNQWKQSEYEINKDKNLLKNDILIIKTVNQAKQNVYQYIHANIFTEPDIDIIEQQINQFYRPKHIQIKDVKPQNKNANYFYWKEYNERLNSNLVLKDENDADVNEMVEQRSHFTRESKHLHQQDEFDELKRNLSQ